MEPSSSSSSSADAPVQREYSDNLTRYQVAEGERRRDVGAGDAWTFKSSSRFTRNTFLSPAWWDLHQYSWRDIEVTMKATSDSLQLWQLLAAEGGEVPPTAIKIPWSQRQFLDSTDKAGVLNKLNALMRERYGKRGPPRYTNKLTAPFPTHVPPIPTQVLTDAEWAEFHGIFGDRIVNPERVYARTFTWRGLPILPFFYCPQNQLLQVLHVMPVADYCRVYGKPKDATEEPFDFKVGPEGAPFYDSDATFWLRLPAAFTATHAAQIPDPYDYAEERKA